MVACISTISKSPIWYGMLPADGCEPTAPVATFGRGFAADLLQMQQGVIIHETLGCRLRQNGDTPHHLSTEPIWFSQHLRRWLCHNQANSAEHRGGYP